MSYAVTEVEALNDARRRANVALQLTIAAADGAP
jgi:hypothetical protein